MSLYINCGIATDGCNTIGRQKLEDENDSFNLQEWVAPQTVMHSIFNVFVRTLCYVEVLLQTAAQHHESTDWKITSMTILWIAKDMLLVIIQSVFSEKFYIAIENAETACIQRMKKRNYTKNQQRLCKNVILTNRTFSRMTACGLFYVDATLIMSLLGLVTTYVVVLLQFGLL